MMRYAGSLVTMTCVTAGAVACATPAAGQALRSEGAGYEVTVLVDGVPAPTFFHAGETYVLGQLGERYVLRVANHTGRRIEAVVSVDGRDVIDGRSGDFRRKRGYLVPAWGSVDIDGWRLSTHQAAAFRFSSVADSYAARTGSARDVGVIGLAVFPERVYSPPPRPYRPYYPYDDASPYRGGYESKSKGEASAEGSGRGSGEAPRASAGASAPASPMADATEAAPSKSMAPPSRRPGLGTEFGEAVSSQVREVEFVRANASRPSVLLGMRYNDRAGLVALGIDVDNAWSPDDTYLRQTAHPFPVSQRGYAAPPPGWRREW
jgi:hypothetical protein